MSDLKPTGIQAGVIRRVGIPLPYNFNEKGDTPSALLAARQEYIRSLGTLFNLDRLRDGITWVETQPTSLYNYPRVELRPIQKASGLAVEIDPTLEGKSLGDLKYHGPLILKDVQPYGQTKLSRYKIAGLSGVPEEKSKLDEPISLGKLIEGTECLKETINDKTPVVKVVGFLPIAENGQFKTEFLPTVLGDDGGNILTVLISEDTLKLPHIVSRYYTQLHKIKDVDEQQKSFSWQADFIPDLSEIERLLLPSKAGQMVIISIPLVDEEKRKAQALGDLYRGLGNYVPDFRGGDEGGFMMKGGGGLRGGSGFKGPSIGGVSIGEGSERKVEYKKCGDVYVDLSRKPIIYHLKLFGVKPGDAEVLTREQIVSMADSIASHETV